MPDYQKPRTGWIITLGVIGGIVAAVLLVLFFLSSARSWLQVVMMAFAAFVTVAGIAVAVAYLSREKAGWRVKIMLAAAPVISVLLAPVMLFLATFQPFQAAKDQHDDLAEAKASPKLTAWGWGTEVTWTVDTYPDDLRKNKHDDAGIDSTDYACSEEADREGREVIDTEGAGEAVDDETDDLDWEIVGPVIGGDEPDRGLTNELDRADGTALVYIGVPVSAGGNIVGQEYIYKTLLEQDMSGWCVSKVTWTGEKRNGK